MGIPPQTTGATAARPHARRFRTKQLLRWAPPARAPSRLVRMRLVRMRLVRMRLVRTRLVRTRLVPLRVVRTPEALLAERHPTARGRAPQRRGNPDSRTRHPGQPPLPRK